MRDASIPKLKHGTLSGYHNHGCRCDACRAANTEYYRKYRTDHREAHAETTRKWRAKHPDYQRDYYANHREKIAEYEHNYYIEHREGERERHCKWQKEHPEYRHNYYIDHREEMIENYRRYYIEHLEEVHERKRKWRAGHPEKVRDYERNRRARKRGNGGAHTDADVFAQYERQKGRCFYCGRKVGDEYHVDHVMPLALSGSNGPENLVIACVRCNESKSAKHPMDFAGMMF
jgi:5-methylcytosine-specific restriction endonuclease McrA